MRDFTVQQLAKRWGISDAQVYRMIESDVIPAGEGYFRLPSRELPNARGGGIRIKREWILQYEGRAPDDDSAPAAA